MGLSALSIQPLITTVVCQSCQWSWPCRWNKEVVEHPVSNWSRFWLLYKWQDMLDYHQTRKRDYSERSIQGNSYQCNSSRSKTFGCSNRVTRVCWGICKRQGDQLDKQDNQASWIHWLNLKHPMCIHLWIKPLMDLFPENSARHSRLERNVVISSIPSLPLQIGSGANWTETNCHFRSVWED